MVKHELFSFAKSLKLENELSNKNLLVKPNTSTNKFEQISRNNRHTAVTNITRQRMSEKNFDFKNLTFRMLQHTSSEVTVTRLQLKFKCEEKEKDWCLIKCNNTNN